MIYGHGSFPANWYHTYTNSNYTVGSCIFTQKHFLCTLEKTSFTLSEMTEQIAKLTIEETIGYLHVPCD